MNVFCLNQIQKHWSLFFSHHQLITNSRCCFKGLLSGLSVKSKGCYFFSPLFVHRLSRDEDMSTSETAACDFSWDEHIHHHSGVRHPLMLSGGLQFLPGWFMISKRITDPVLTWTKRKWHQPFHSATSPITRHQDIFNIWCKKKCLTGCIDTFICCVLSHWSVTFFTAGVWILLR